MEIIIYLIFQNEEGKPTQTSTSHVRKTLYKYFPNTRTAFTNKLKIHFIYKNHAAFALALPFTPQAVCLPFTL